MTTIAISADPAEAVLNVLREQNEGWNAGDVALYSRSVGENVTFTNIRGQHLLGREAFVKQHAFIFDALFKGTRLTQQIVSLQFIGTDLALLDTLTAVTGLESPLPYMKLDASGALRTRLLQVIVREEEEWKVVAYHNVDVKP